MFKKKQKEEFEENRKLQNLLDFFQDYKDESEFHDILMQLQNGESDIDLKTEIFKPRGIAVLQVLRDYLTELGLKMSSNILDSFIMHYLRNMFSYKRESRKEIISALQNLKTKIEERVRVEELR